MLTLIRREYQGLEMTSSRNSGIANPSAITYVSTGRVDYS